MMYYIQLGVIIWMTIGFGNWVYWVTCINPFVTIMDFTVGLVFHLLAGPLLWLRPEK